jgi:hypothetical protein
MGLEGIVSKRKASSYRSGRSTDWVKSKKPACAAVQREGKKTDAAGAAPVQSAAQDAHRHGRQFLHLAAGAATLPAASRALRILDTAIRHEASNETRMTLDLI